MSADAACLLSRREVPHFLGGLSTPFLKKIEGMLANLESYNTVLINQGKNQKERMELLYISREKPTLHGRLAHLSRSFSPVITVMSPARCFLLIHQP